MDMIVLLDARFRLWTESLVEVRQAFSVGQNETAREKLRWPEGQTILYKIALEECRERG
jgi:hypothetical protein